MNPKSNSLYEVTDEDNLYHSRVGSLIAETALTTILLIDNEDVVFLKGEVKRII